MDNETAKYIITYFSNLLTDAEKMAIKHTHSIYKRGDSAGENTSWTRIYKKAGWITDEQNVLDLLKGGFEQFELNVANRILSENADSVFLNNCPKCGKLTKTPYARQCRHCSHRWHDLIAAQFKLKNSFEAPSGDFFLTGQITKGEIKHGQFIDLTMLQINNKAKIVTIEVTEIENGGEICKIGLDANELTANEKKYIKNKGSFATTFDILKER